MYQFGGHGSESKDVHGNMKDGCDSIVVGNLVSPYGMLIFAKRETLISHANNVTLDVVARRRKTVGNVMGYCGSFSPQIEPMEAERYVNRITKSVQFESFVPPSLVENMPRLTWTWKMM